MSEEAKESNHLADYRNMLIASEQKSQESFDKTVLTLSGGALGISFVFLKDVIGPNPIEEPFFLLASWSLWALSTFAVLTSYYFSQRALRLAVLQVDQNTIYEQSPGGKFAKFTAFLNAAGVIFFFFGVISITVFAGLNLSSKGNESDWKKDINTSTAAECPDPSTVETTGTETPSNERHPPATATTSTEEK